MKKKTVEEKFDMWFECYLKRKSFQSIFDCYKAGHKSAAIELGRELRKKEKQVTQLQKTVGDLLDACERYARTAAEIEAKYNAFKSVEWEKTHWKFVDIGDTVKFVYGDAGNVWRLK